MSLGENVHKECLQFPWLETMAGAKVPEWQKRMGRGIQERGRERTVRVKGDIGIGSREQPRTKY